MMGRPLPWQEEWRAEWRDADGKLVAWDYIYAPNGVAPLGVMLRSTKWQDAIKRGAVGGRVVRADSPMRFEASP